MKTNGGQDTLRSITAERDAAIAERDQGLKDADRVCKGFQRERDEARAALAITEQDRVGAHDAISRLATQLAAAESRIAELLNTIEVLKRGTP